MNCKNIISSLVRIPFVLFKEPRYFLYRVKYILLSPVYQRFILPIKVRKVRKKSIIDVLFVLNELGCWKTETLYLKMLKHSRFNPKLLLVPAEETPEALDVLRNYLNEKGYLYEDVSESSYKKQFQTDIIFYQKPYDNVMNNKYFYLYHLDKLFCYVLYGFRNRNYPKIKNVKFVKFVWQFYAENSKVIEESSSVFSTKGRNLINTGLSFMDDLLLDKESYQNPWKDCGTKKKIIYAPHHTIVSDIYEYSTFLDYCDFMLDMAEKYKDKVQWAFKPHPVLKGKLINYWGEEKTNAYYKKWETMENSQINRCSVEREDINVENNLSGLVYYVDQNSLISNSMMVTNKIFSANYGYATGFAYINEGSIKNCAYIVIDTAYRLFPMMIPLILLKRM